MAIPPNYFSGTNLSIQDSATGTDADLIAQTSLGFLQKNSVVGTDIIFTESDQTLIQQWLDQTNNPLGTEKFGIETNVALFDSNQDVTQFTDIHTVPLYSVTDSAGRVLDLGSFQVTFNALTQNQESELNVWGKVIFYLDDNPIGTKYIWGSAINTDKLELSVVDNLSFKYEPNADADIAIATQQSKVNSLNEELNRRIINQSNTGRFIPDTSIPALRDQINTEIAKLNVLQNTQGSDIKRALSPVFSEQDKNNFTFTLSDEGTDWADGSEHTVRVVISEVHADANSSGDFKEFNSSVQYIAYSLDMTVDGTKKVVIGENNQAVQIFKSDNTLKLCGAVKFYHLTSPYNPTSFGNNPPKVTVKDSTGNVILEASHTTSGPINSSYTTCSTFDGIPRGESLIFTIDGVDYPVITPSTQVNYIVNAEVVQTGTNVWNGFIAGRERTSSYPVIATPTSSNFGYP